MEGKGFYKAFRFRVVQNVDEIILDGIHWVKKKNGKFRCKYLKYNKCSIWKDKPALCKNWFCFGYNEKRKCINCRPTCCDEMDLIYDEYGLHICRLNNNGGKNGRRTFNIKFKKDKFIY